jgi:hypothetical protein
VAAVTLRLAEPWHHKGPHVVMADAWFGGLLNAFSLLLRGQFCIVDVKQQTKHFGRRSLGLVHEAPLGKAFGCSHNRRQP